MNRLPLLVRVRVKEGRLVWPDFNAIEVTGGDWKSYVDQHGAMCWDFGKISSAAIKLCLMVVPREFALEANRRFRLAAVLIPPDMAREFIEQRTHWGSWERFLRESHLQG